MTIEFACPECTHPVKTPDSQQGKRGRCPSCQAIFTIPENTVSDSAATERTIRFECHQCNKKLKVPVSRADKKITCPQCGAVVTNEEIKSSGSLSGILTTDGKIEFPCGECGHVVQTPASQAGKKGRCPECQQIMQIPVPSINPSSQRTESRFTGPAPPPMGMSLINDFSEPLEELNQEPLDNWGDDLISNSHPVVSSLPTAGGSGGGRYRSQGTRKGLPWDRNDQDSVFWGTATEVLFSPLDAFSRMQRDGGIGSSLGFALTGQLMGAAIALGFFLVFGIVALVSGITYAPESRPVDVSGSILFGLIVAIVFTVVYLIGTAINCLLQTVVLAAFQHVGLTVVQGAYEAFETTCRVAGYVIGSFGLLMILTPFVGIPLQIVALPIYMGIGCYAAHETTKGQAIGGTLIGYLVWYGLFFGSLTASYQTIWTTTSKLLQSS
ncbi:MAG: hypothetical protein VB862_05635 [Pirellulaceae bacterium]